MATRIGGGGGTAVNIDRTIKRSTRRSSSPRTTDDERAVSSANTQRWAQQNPRAARQLRKRRRSLGSIANAEREREREPAQQPIDAERARSSLTTRRWATANPVAARQLRSQRRSLATIANAPVNYSDYSTRLPLKRREAGAGPLGIGGALRVVGHTVGGIASAVYRDPVEANVKAVGTLVEGAKAIPQTLGLVGALSTAPIMKGIEAVAGNVSDVDEESVGAAKEMGGQIAKSYSKKYGPSFRGEKGSGAKLRKQIRKEGPLPSTLDLATVAVPTSAALGAGARTGTLGARAQSVATRPTRVRYGVNEVVEIPQRRGAVGIAVREGHNVVRRAAQRRAIKRADAGKPHGRIGDRRPGLPAHRAVLQEGELAPFSNARAARRQRFLVAEETNRRDIRIKQRLAKYVAGPAGLMQAQRLVQDPEARPLIGLTRQLGIRSSADVAKIVPDRLKQIDEALEAARRVQARRELGADSPYPKGTPEAEADAALASKLDPAELTAERAMLEALRDNPKLADTAGLAEAAARTGAIQAEAVGGREGLSADRKALGRTARQGETVGVKRADELNAEAERGHATELAAARTREQAARQQRDQVQARVKRDLSKARERVQVAKGRADIKGKGQARRQATLAAAQRDLERVRQEASTELAEVSDIVRARQVERKAVAAAMPRKIKETGEEYAARVDAEFERRGLAQPGYAPGHYEVSGDEMVVEPAALRPPSVRNSLRHKSEGTTARLGAQAFDPDAEKDLLVSNVKRGANLEAEANILARQGRFFDDPAEAERFIAGLGGVARTKGGEQGGWSIIVPTLLRKDTAGATIPDDLGARDRGDYVANHGGVFAVPAAVKAELDALGARPSAIGTIMRRLAHAPQTALLAMSPSWFVFQRVNDLVGMSFGGSILQARALQRARTELRAEDPDAADLVEMFSGGSASRTQLNPYAGQALGRAQRLVDENPRLRDAWNSDTPAYNLLGLSPKLVNSAVWIGKKAPTGLLRADARITGAARELQYIQNLKQFAAKADPEVKAVIKATGPMGHALKTSDVDLIAKLLKDPKYAKVREDAAEALNRVMGDWHTFTAAERSVKDFAAFYGFLRYSTRMLMYTLPVDHPLLALTVAQLGAMNAAYAKSIIGDDIPYGLGALYSKSGKVITDLTRANPLTGPFMQVDKPEKLLGVGTPLIGIVTSGLFGLNVGLTDTTTGYMSRISTDRNSTDYALSMSDRAQIVLDQTMSLLSPYKAVKGMDKTPQSGDSTLFNKQPLVAKSAEEHVKLADKKKRAGSGGVDSLLADFFPLFFADGRNWKDQGAHIAKTKASVEKRRLDEQAKFKGAQTPMGKARIRLDSIDARIEAKMGSVEDKVAEIDERIARNLRARGLEP